ncbi:MAG: amino acid adenylation domain-containing protein [Actinoplanes sp.]
MLVTAHPPAGAGIAELVHAQVRRHGSALAVVDDHTVLTYDRLWRRASALAGRLAEAGAGNQDRVGMAVAGSADVVVAFLGVILADCVPVPLDPSYPAARLSFIADDARTDIVVGSTRTLEDLPADLFGKTLIDLAELPDRMPDTHFLVRRDQRSSGRLSYLLYTSGSTGEPKGVMYREDSFVSLACWQVEDSILRGRGPRRTLQFAPASFDVSFQEVFSTLLGGGTMVCPDPAVRSDPGLLSRVIMDQRVERIFVPFIALQLLAAFGERTALANSVLREVVSAGEQLKCTDEIIALFDSTGATLVNQYGPTETHAVLRHRMEGNCRDWPRLPPVGTPVRGVRLPLLVNNAPVPQGQEGELTVVGDVVADGYLGRPDLTAQRFAVAPDGARSYRTGDLLRVDQDGLFHFVGRADDQVKIRGVRIEPAEIEAVLGNSRAVSSVAVTAVGDTAMDRVLVAVLVLAPGTTADIRELRSFLLKQVPKHLVPRDFITVDELPRLPSGKIDRGAVRALATDATRHQR